MAFFTWSAVRGPDLLPLLSTEEDFLVLTKKPKAFASAARDLVLCGTLVTLAIGSTIACCLFAYGGGVSVGMYVAAYFFIISAILAWWRVTVYLCEEAYGKSGVKFLPIFRTSMEKGKPLLVPGVGEPGVKRGMPGVV